MRPAVKLLKELAHSLSQDDWNAVLKLQEYGVHIVSMPEEEDGPEGWQLERRGRIIVINHDMPEQLINEQLRWLFH